MEDIKDYIIEHKSDIDNHDFDKVYIFGSEDPEDGVVNRQISLLALSSGVNPLNYLTSTIPYDAFTGVELHSDTVIIPEGITKIEQFAFEYSEAKKIILPNSIKEIGKMAFSSSYLVECDIPEGVINLEMGTFSTCLSLTKVYLPNTLKTIGDLVFSECFKLKTIIYNGTIEQWKQVYKGRNWMYKTRMLKIQCIDGVIEKKMYTDYIQ